MIHPPKFWQQEKGFLSALLWPLSKIYELLVWANSFRVTERKAKIPVICIGNLTLGGAGKTPTAIAITEILKDEKININFVSRGYGRKSTDTKQVDLNTDTSETVGDEPLLLAQVAPTWVSSDRAAAIDLAYKQGAEVVILDDGLQNKSVHKDLSILVVDSKLGFGNGCVFPAGPLRVSVKEGLKNVDAVLVVESSAPLLPMDPDFPATPYGYAVASRRDGLKATFTATPTLEIPQEIIGKKVIAFAGIAYPHKFFDGLKSEGIEIAETFSFPDHHSLSEAEFQGLLEKAKRYTAPLITTQKDFMRLPLEKRPLVIPIPYHLRLENSFIQFIKQKTNELTQKPF